MKILLLGLGRQGQRILELLAKRKLGQFCLYDVNADLLNNLQAKYADKVELISQNPFELSEGEQVTFLQQYDYIIDALPAAFSFQVLKVGAKAGAKIVSVAFLEEDFMALNASAQESNALIVPDCGVAPGLSHLLAAYAVKQLGGADKVLMKLGAIPLNPQAPFFHNITWSANDLTEEYVRPGKVRKNGSLLAVDPFEDIAEEEICGFKLQSFITDGARSFLSNFPDVPDMEERTLRHYGHLDYMAKFKKNGQLRSDSYKEVVEFIETQFGSLPLEDMFLMEIIAAKNEKTLRQTYLLNYDKNKQVPALVNAVAITAVQTLQLMRDEVINKSGVLPLELLASEEVYQSILQAHRDFGAIIEVK